MIRNGKEIGLLYHVTGFCPRTDITMGRCGFGIVIFPAMKEAVKASGYTQANIDAAIGSMHRAWLDGYGYDTVIDPDEDPLDAWKKERGVAVKKPKPGKNAYPLYDANSIRVGWGPWGVEHITVPGDACGLDIDGGVTAPRGGMALLPHNVDCIAQMGLLLCVFTYFAEAIIYKAGE